MKICFWGDLVGALTGNTNGGGELQIALLAKALASWQPRDIDEDPIGYCIKRDGVLDLTCASKSIEMVGSRAFAENKWHPSSSIVVPLFARPGAG